MIGIHNWKEDVGSLQGECRGVGWDAKICMEMGENDMVWKVCKIKPAV